ncbi:MAG: aminoglycoside phosphotransferase [Kangiellaceae bacterium]|jgi:aminoglycoside phosphotransferase
MIEKTGLKTALKQFFMGAAFDKVETVQSLWSGYGEIARYSIRRSSQGQSTQNTQTCIAKIVSLQSHGQHPRGWNTNISHQRKLSSYVNEQHFYQYFAAYTNEYCKVPELLAASADDKNVWLLMQDLDAAGFADRSVNANLALIELGVKWLANFHACFMHDTGSDNIAVIDTAIDKKTHSTSAHSRPWQQYKSKVWPIGTYWHLATRKQEWQAMPASDLKNKASKIDQHLNNARFQTLLHGDAKLANFCIHVTKAQVAAVDFQYVGFGVGIKDLVYFLGSCLDGNKLQRYTPGLLDIYFSALTKALTLVPRNVWEPHSQIDFGQLEKEYRALYSIAWADFERFLIGWSPRHIKLNQYSCEQTRLALLKISSL